MANQVTLTEDDVFNISRSTPAEAVRIVRDAFHCDYRTVSDILRNRILYDALLDHVKYCLTKGLSLQNCVNFACFFNSLIVYIKKNPSITLDQFLIHVANGISQFNNKVASSQLKHILDYLNDTLFVHFDLYKHVFTRERDAMVKDDNVVVNCPPKENFIDQSLATSRPYHIWEYESKLREIERKEKEADKKFLERRLKLAEEEHQFKYGKKIETEEFEQLDEESLSNLIDSIAKPILDTTVTIIKNDIEEIKENLLIGLEKNLLPRPDELGPLPPLTSKTFKTAETKQNESPRRPLDKKDSVTKSPKGSAKKPASGKQKK